MKTEQRKCCCGGLPALWWWLLALLGAGLLYLGMIANKQNPIEQDLTQRSTETLTKLGYDWVKPVVDQRGRDVYLSGIAPDDASRTQAIQNVQNLYGVRTVDASGLKVVGDPVVNTSTAANNTAAGAGTLAVGTASGLITAGAESNQNGATANTTASVANTTTTATPDATTPATNTASTPNAPEANTLATTTAAVDANATGTMAAPGIPEGNANSNAPAPATNEPSAVATTTATEPTTQTPATANATTPEATVTTEPTTPASAPTVATNTTTNTPTPAAGTAGNANTTTTPSSEPIQLNTPTASTPAAEANNAQVLAPTSEGTATNTTATATPEPVVAPEPEPVVVLDDKQQVCQNRFSQEMGDKTIQFNVNKAVISPRSYPLLDILAAIAQECAGVLGNLKVEIGGHTDSDGDEGYNQLLSEQRAGAVKQYLVRKGVDTALLTVRGYGESRPVASNLTREGRAQNRRIEFKLK